MKTLVAIVALALVFVFIFVLAAPVAAPLAAAEEPKMVPATVPEVGSPSAIAPKAGGTARTSHFRGKASWGADTADLQITIHEKDGDANVTGQYTAYGPNYRTNYSVPIWGTRHENNTYQLKGGGCIQFNFEIEGKELTGTAWCLFTTASILSPIRAEQW